MCVPHTMTRRADVRVPRNLCRASAGEQWTSTPLRLLQVRDSEIYTVRHLLKLPHVSLISCPDHARQPPCGPWLLMCRPAAAGFLFTDSYRAFLQIYSEVTSVGDAYSDSVYWDVMAVGCFLHLLPWRLLTLALSDFCLMSLSMCVDIADCC